MDTHEQDQGRSLETRTARTRTRAAPKSSKAPLDSRRLGDGLQVDRSHPVALPQSQRTRTRQTTSSAGARRHRRDPRYLLVRGDTELKYDKLRSRGSWLTNQAGFVRGRGGYVLAKGHKCGSRLY